MEGQDQRLLPPKMSWICPNLRAVNKAEANVKSSRSLLPLLASLTESQQVQASVLGGDGGRWLGMKLKSISESVPLTCSLHTQSRKALGPFVHFTVSSFSGILLFCLMLLSMNTEGLRIGGFPALIEVSSIVRSFREKTTMSFSGNASHDFCRFTASCADVMAKMALGHILG